MRVRTREDKEGDEGRGLKRDHIYQLKKKFY